MERTQLDDGCITVLDEPLKPWQIRNDSNSEGWIEGVIAVDLSDIVDAPDLEAFLNLLGEKLVGPYEVLMQQSYTVVGHTGEKVLLRVNADANEMLRNMDPATEQCQNCGNMYLLDELTNPIPDLAQRVAPGEPMPSGECPEPQCGAVCHTLKVEK